MGNLPFDVKVCFHSIFEVKGLHNRRLYLLLDLTCYFCLQDEELYKLFCGMANLESSIEAVRVVRDPHMNLGKGIAYVLFKTRVCFFPLLQDH